MDLKGKTAVFLGDSITAGSGTSGEDKRYYEVLKRKYGLKEVTGYGVGGTRYAVKNTPEDEFAEYFSLRADRMREDADIVVVFGATNDYGHGNAPLGTFADRTPHTFYGACHELYRKLIQKYPESTIVVMTPLHRCNEYSLRGDGSKTYDDAPLVTYVDIILEVARYYSLPVCDLYANSGLQPDIPIIKEKYIPDGLHPNDRGNEILAEKLGEFLKTL